MIEPENGLGGEGIDPEAAEVVQIAYFLGNRAVAIEKNGSASRRNIRAEESVC
jgi:hypothetical protein